MSTVTTVSDDTSVVACGKPNSHVVSREVDLSSHIQAEAFMLHSVASCYFTVRPSIDVYYFVVMQFLIYT